MTCFINNNACKVQKLQGIASNYFSIINSNHKILYFSYRVIILFEILNYKTQRSHHNIKNMDQSKLHFRVGTVYLLILFNVFQLKFRSNNLRHMYIFLFLCYLIGSNLIFDILFTIKADKADDIMTV